MDKRIWIGTAVVFVVIALLDFVFNMTIMADDYAATAALWRPEAEMKIWLFYVVYAFPAFFFTLIFSKALHVALQSDPKAVLMGQDIAEYGGVFKCTEGFVEEFGKERVRNTPIIESGAVGCAMGLALEGFRPMLEMQFGDFISCGFNQIVNNLAKTHYRWGAPVGVVLRVPDGGGVGAGPFHSQNVESWFTSVAGLKVVAPATPFDVTGLLLPSFEDGNPVLFLEHKLLYRSSRGRVPAGHFTLPIGQAAVARPGRHASVITWGVGVSWALDAAARLAAEGREVEVIDLRTLLPWDRDTVLDSVRRTGRALVLHEAPLTGGLGAEVASTIGSETFEWLDAPVARLGALDTPVPSGKALEAVFSPKGRLRSHLRRGERGDLRDRRGARIRSSGGERRPPRVPGQDLRAQASDVGRG